MGLNTALACVYDYSMPLYLHFCHTVNCPFEIQLTAELISDQPPWLKHPRWFQLSGADGLVFSQSEVSKTIFYSCSPLVLIVRAPSVVKAVSLVLGVTAEQCGQQT